MAESKKPAAPRGAWAAYNPGNLGQVACCSSAVSALWIAVEAGWKVVPWPWGLTLKEAIGRAEADAAKSPKAVQS